MGRKEPNPPPKPNWKKLEPPPYPPALQKAEEKMEKQVAKLIDQFNSIVEEECKLAKSFDDNCYLEYINTPEPDILWEVKIYFREKDLISRVYVKYEDSKIRIYKDRIGLKNHLNKQLEMV